MMYVVAAPFGALLFLCALTAVVLGGVAGILVECFSTGADCARRRRRGLARRTFDGYDPSMRISRTYPQPDSPEPHLGPRERALAVFKYLLDLEPEVAVMHSMFACVEHAFQQAAHRGWVEGEYGLDLDEIASRLGPSLVPMLTSSRTFETDERRFVSDEGRL